MAVKKKVSFSGAVAQVHISSTFNNTIITVTDEKGHTLAWATAGASGFKGTKKGTPYAAQIASANAGKKAYDMGVRSVRVFVKGPGPGREVAIRALQTVGIQVLSIKDTTPIPHNGCRPPKKRRV